MLGSPAGPGGPSQRGGFWPLAPASAPTATSTFTEGYSKYGVYSLFPGGHSFANTLFSNATPLGRFTSGTTLQASSGSSFHTHKIADSLFSSTGYATFGNPTPPPGSPYSPIPVAQLELLTKGFNSSNIIIQQQHQQEFPASPKKIQEAKLEKCCSKAVCNCPNKGKAEGCSRTNPIEWNGVNVKKEPGTPCQVAEVTTSLSPVVKLEIASPTQKAVTDVHGTTIITNECPAAAPTATGQAGQVAGMASAVGTGGGAFLQCSEDRTAPLAGWQHGPALSTPTLWQYPAHLPVEPLVPVPMSPLGLQLVRDPNSGHLLLLPTAGIEPVQQTVVWPSYPQPSNHVLLPPLPPPPLQLLSSTSSEYLSSNTTLHQHTQTQSTRLVAVTTDVKRKIPLPIPTTTLIKIEADTSTLDQTKTLQAVSTISTNAATVLTDQNIAPLMATHVIYQHPTNLIVSQTNTDTTCRSQATSPVACLTPPAEEEEKIVQDASNQTDATICSEEETILETIDTKTVEYKTKDTSEIHMETIGIDRNQNSMVLIETDKQIITTEGIVLRDNSSKLFINNQTNFKHSIESQTTTTPETIKLMPAPEKMFIEELTEKDCELKIPQYSGINQTMPNNVPQKAVNENHVQMNVQQNVLKLNPNINNINANTNQVNGVLQQESENRLQEDENRAHENKSIFHDNANRLVQESKIRGNAGQEKKQLVKATMNGTTISNNNINNNNIYKDADKMVANTNNAIQNNQKLVYQTSTVINNEKAIMRKEASIHRNDKVILSMSGIKFGVNSVQPSPKIIELPSEDVDKKCNSNKKVSSVPPVKERSEKSAIKPEKSTSKQQNPDLSGLELLSNSIEEFENRQTTEKVVKVKAETEDLKIDEKTENDESFGGLNLLCALAEQRILEEVCEKQKKSRDCQDNKKLLIGKEEQDKVKCNKPLISNVQSDKVPTKTINNNFQKDDKYKTYYRDIRKEYIAKCNSKSEELDDNNEIEKVSLPNKEEQKHKSQDPRKEKVKRSLAFDENDSSFPSKVLYENKNENRTCNNKIDNCKLEIENDLKPIGLSTKYCCENSRESTNLHRKYNDELRDLKHEDSLSCPCKKHCCENELSARELDMKKKLENLQRKYKEKQKALSKLKKKNEHKKKCSKKTKHRSKSPPVLEIVKEEEDEALNRKFEDVEVSPPKMARYESSEELPMNEIPREKLESNIKKRKVGRPKKFSSPGHQTTTETIVAKKLKKGTLVSYLLAAKEKFLQNNSMFANSPPRYIEDSPKRVHKEPSHKTEDVERRHKKEGKHRDEKSSKERRHSDSKSHDKKHKEHEHSSKKKQRSYSEKVFEKEHTPVPEKSEKVKTIDNWPKKYNNNSSKCLLTENHLEVDKLRVLTAMGGLFYAGHLNAIEPPDVYSIVLDGERGNRPHIMSREDILRDAIVEVSPKSTEELVPGTRLCAYWSQQYRCLYPGSVAEPGTPDPELDSKFVSVEFDDGDSGKIALEDIRLLPSDYPIIEYDPNPLLSLSKRKRRISISNEEKTNTITDVNAVNMENHEIDSEEEKRERKRLKKHRKEKRSDEKSKKRKKHKHDEHHKKHKKSKKKHHDEETVSAKQNDTSYSEYSSIPEEENVEEEDVEDDQNIGVEVDEPHIEVEQQEIEEENECHNFEETNLEEGDEEEIDALAESIEGDGESEDEEASEGETSRTGKIRDRQASCESRSKMSAFLPAKQLWAWRGPGYKRGKGRQRKTFYKSVQRGKEIIKVNDAAVFLSTSRPDRPYIGKIKSLWESAGKMSVKIQWYYHPEETEGKKVNVVYPGALFASEHEDDNDVQTISQKCNVLSYETFVEKLDQNPDLAEKIYENHDLYYLGGYYDIQRKKVRVEPGINHWFLE